MGSLKTLALAGGLALGASVAAHAADLAYPPPPPPEPLGLKGTISSGFYLRGDVGVGIGSYDKIDVRSDGINPGAIPQVSSFRTIKPNSEFVGFVGFGAGYRFNNWLRFDVTGEYRGWTFNGRDQITYDFGGGRTDQFNSYRANVSSFVGLANGYIDLGTWNCLTPYLGAGVGFAYHSVNGLTDNGVNQTVGGGPNVSFAYGDSATKTSLAWALMAGFSYDLTTSLKLDVGYRYLNLGDGPQIALAGPTGPLTNPSSSVRIKGIDSHDFRIGLRWDFSDPNCCGPAPVAYAPPVVRKY